MHVNGKVLKVITKNKVEVRYTTPNKVVTTMATLPAHGMKVGETIKVVIKPCPRLNYGLIRIYKIGGTCTNSNFTANGEIVQIINANKVKVRYHDFNGKLVTHTAHVKAHAMKVGQITRVTTSGCKPYTLISISRKPPAPKPGYNPCTQSPLHVDGKILKIINKNRVRVRYTTPDGIVTANVTLQAHRMKVGEVIEVMIAPCKRLKYKLIRILKKGAEPTGGPCTRSPRTLNGKVTEIGTNFVKVRYTTPEKVVRIKNVKAPAHKMKVGEAVKVMVIACKPYNPISVSKNTPTPVPVPGGPCTRSPITINGKVTEIGTNLVKVRYTTPEKVVRIKNVKAPAHKMKVGEAVKVMVIACKPYNPISVSKNTPGACTKPSSIVNGKVAQVTDINTIKVKYTTPDKKVVTRNVRADRHQMIVGEPVKVQIDGCQPYNPLSVSKTGCAKSSRTVGGTVLLVLDPNRVRIRYTTPAKILVNKDVAANNHQMQNGEAIRVTIKGCKPYDPISVSKKTPNPNPKPKPKPVPVPGGPCTQSPITINGKVTAVQGAKVTVRYRAPDQKVRNDVVPQTAPKMKKNDAVKVMVIACKPYKRISVSK
jgi:hypothetical protein